MTLSVAKFLFQRVGIDMKKILVLIIFLMMSRVEAAGWSPELRIGLLSNVEEISLQVSAPCIMIDAKSKKTLKKLPANKKITVKAKDIKAASVDIRPEKIQLKDLRATIDEREYFGGVRLNVADKKFTVINLVPMEEYLRGVLPEEMSSSYPAEALKAQAVAARSFALKNRDKHKKNGFDLCDKTHCQLYIGAKTFETTDKAVAETFGEILTYKDKLIETSFHADSGGVTENASDVWGRVMPCLVTVKEVFKQVEPWTVKVSVKDFSSRFGDNFGVLKKIELSELKIGKGAKDRTSSGRVDSAQIVGSKKTLTLSGIDLRRKFSLPSTLFDIKIDGDNVIFTGYGSGHGVGMSQKGAKAYALDGWSYKKILEHYYHDAKLKKLY